MYFIDFTGIKDSFIQFYLLFGAPWTIQRKEDFFRELKFICLFGSILEPTALLERCRI